MASMSRCTLARPPLPGSRYANEAPESGVMGLPPPSELTLLRMVSAPAGSATKSLGELKALSPLGVPLSKPSVMQRRGVAETVAVLVTVWVAVLELVGSGVELREGVTVAVSDGVSEELTELVAELEKELDGLLELVPVVDTLPVWVPDGVLEISMIVMAAAVTAKALDAPGAALTANDRVWTPERGNT